MLREPDRTTNANKIRKHKQPGRFQVRMLEERIAPACFTNSQGKEVGNCGKHPSGPGQPI